MITIVGCFGCYLTAFRFPLANPFNNLHTQIFSAELRDRFIKRSVTDGKRRLGRVYRGISNFIGNIFTRTEFRRAYSYFDSTARIESRSSILRSPFFSSSPFPSSAMLSGATSQNLFLRLDFPFAFILTSTRVR